MPRAAAYSMRLSVRSKKMAALASRAFSSEVDPVRVKKTHQNNDSAASFLVQSEPKL
jgi:hypothetical protein